MHAYWLLREPLDLTVEADEAKTLLRRLAGYLGADLQSAEPARVLRVPNTRNYNPDYTSPPRVTVEVFEPDRRYNPSNFDWLPALDITSPASTSPVSLTEPIPKGHRNGDLYKVGRGLKAKGLPPSAIAETLRHLSVTACEPALPAEELEELVAHVVRQPDRPDFQLDTSALDCEALLATHELSGLDEGIDRAVLDERLRSLAGALRGADSLRVALVREALVTELKHAKIGTPTAIVDAALKIVASGSNDQQGTPLLLADVEPWPGPVDGKLVVTKVMNLITRFIVLPTHGAVALALWILHTYLMDTWTLSPLAVAKSPTRRCGKTALLTVVAELVYRALAASNISPAALFRAVEKYQPTLLLDEGETWLKGNEELRGIVNAGHTRRTAVVIRTVGDEHEPTTFSTWCPKFIALIGELPDTLMDRAIPIEMRRKTASERVERLRQDHLPDICDPLRRQMARWAADHAASIAALDPEVPSGLHDRAADNWRPLLAISDALGGEWPTRARAAAQALAGTDQEDTIGVQLLWDVKEVFADEPVLSSKAIIDALVALEDRPWATWSKQDKPMTGHALARLLRKFHIVPAGTIRIGHTTHKGYRRTTFADAWARYPLIEPSHRNKPNNDGAETDKSDHHSDIECDGLRTPVEPMNTKDCDDVTVENHGEGDSEETEMVEDDGWTPAA